jgi:quercetin 2,3-dioxygenase
MIILRRAEARNHAHRHERDIWLTFDSTNRVDPLADGFGALENVSEDRLRPRARLPRQQQRSAELITYVREGALACTDASGSCMMRAGEFQHLTVARESDSCQNPSSSDWAHVFQISMALPAHAEPGREQKRFSAADRRGVLCLVASPDGRRRSLRIYEDVLMYSAILEPGQHVVHALAPQRSAWLHLVHGEGLVRDIILTAGDGVGITTERSVSLTAREPTEVLLFDVKEPNTAHELRGYPS